MYTVSRTFRIFLSSTFTDFKEERDALQRIVFPKIKDLCQAHGFNFQVIDLRWGIGEEAALDHQTMKICFEEIERCQKTTPRPNFIILLGDKYGWQPLPAEIPADEFELILSKVSNEERNLLLWDPWNDGENQGWYRKDNNKVPPVYLLQPRTGKYEDYNTWNTEIEIPLRNILCEKIKETTLDPQKLEKYFCSATEQEIIKGALQCANPSANVLGFFKHFSDIDNILKDQKNSSAYRDFIDTFADGDFNREGYSRIISLKENLKLKLKENIHEYLVTWEELYPNYMDTGISERCANLDPFSVGSPPPTFCDDVYNRLSSIILEEINHFEEVPESKRDNEAHKEKVFEDQENFFGRESLFSDIDNYIKSGEQTPLVIYGESGSGKSAAIAAYVRRVNKPNNTGNYIYRFIGLTPLSADISTLLKGICIEYAELNNTTFDLGIEDYSKILDEFNRLLLNATADKPLVILLDALNQLSDSEGAHGLSWLPIQLPPYVSIITTSTEGDCYDILTSRFPLPQFIHISQLGVDEAENIFNHWLNHNQRKISEDQWKIVKLSIANNKLPLYLKLIFLESLNWKSYTPLENIEIEPEVKLQIRSFFRRLEREENHGKILVSRCMGYFGAARSGLTEEQLVSILSHDEVILRDFRRRSPKSPDINELPVIIWSRLYFDLNHFITHKNIYGVPILAFFHTQIYESISENYLDDSEQYRRAIATFFESQQINEQKIDELPWQLERIHDWNALEKCLTDLEMLSYILADNASAKRKYEWIHYWKLLEPFYNKVECYSRALENVHSMDIEPMKLARYYNDVGAFFYYLADYINAKTFFWKGLQIRRENKAEPEQIIRSLNNVVCADSNIINLTFSFKLPSNFNEIESMAREAVELCNVTENLPDTLINITYNNFACVMILKNQQTYEKEEKEKIVAETEKIFLDAASQKNLSIKALIFTNLAVLKYDIKDFNGAINYNLEAIKIFKSLQEENFSPCATSHINLGHSLFDIHRYDEAKAHLLFGIPIIEKEGGVDAMELSDALLILGMIQIYEGDNSGLTNIFRSFKILKKQMRSFWICITYFYYFLKMGCHQAKNGHIISTLKTFTYGIFILFSAFYDLFFYFGSILRDIYTNFNSSLQKKEKQILKGQGNADSIGLSFDKKANIRKTCSDLDGAMTLYKEQEQICREQGDISGLGQSLGCQANILNTLDDLKCTMAFHKEEERIYRELGDVDRLQRSLGNQANLLKAQGDLDGAINLYKEQGQICRELGCADSLRRSLGNRANLLKTKGDFDGARTLHNEEEQICKKLGNIDSLETFLEKQKIAWQLSAFICILLILTSVFFIFNPSFTFQNITIYLIPTIFIGLGLWWMVKYKDQFILGFGSTILGILAFYLPLELFVTIILGGVVIIILIDAIAHLGIKRNGPSVITRVLVVIIFLLLAILVFENNADLSHLLLVILGVIAFLLGVLFLFDSISLRKKMSMT
jgi:tetratricopeptide (TPR) repeat protein